MPSHSKSATWTDQLGTKCHGNGYSPPVFQIVSDRRGGRTAWSSTVTVSLGQGYSQSFSARFWYDGKNIQNAKEDAAEVACNWLKQYEEASSCSSPSTSRSGGW